MREATCGEKHPDVAMGPPSHGPLAHPGYTRDPLRSQRDFQMTIADVRSTKRSVEAPKASKPAARQSPKQDLRSWLDALLAVGEVQEVRGAEREREIGGIVDLYMRKMGNPAVLFDDIPGYPSGRRILANIL